MNSQQQQTPQPTRSTPLHPSRPSKTPMLPTPSSSRSATLTYEQLLQSKVELEQQLTDKEQQCQDCESGIQKNVLTRQISQIRDKLVELDQQIHQVQQAQKHTDNVPPATIDKIRLLERDLVNYRGQQRKDKPFHQRGLDILPSPSTSTLLPPNATVPNSSLLPLPPPPSGSTPTKRRSKVPNNDRRNTDIEFATEIGQGLLIEVRKMQAILQEKEEQLRALEIQKADLERSAEAMAKQLRQREENEEKLKEETWNLELTKQELTLSVTELQQHLHKATSEHTKLAKQTNDLRSDIDQLRDREEKLTALLETSKQRHEQDMTSLRRHCASLQREAQQHAKHIDTLTSELAIAKAQSRLGKHQSATSGATNNSSGSNGQLSSDDSDPSNQDPQYRSGTSSSSPPSSPKQTPVASNGGRTAQAMEVETLKTSLAHAHRMVSNLRSHLHKEKTEKFEFKKLLAESQETIEQLQNDPHLWVDATNSSSSHQGGASANGSLDDQKKRKVKQHRRATRKLIRAGMGTTGNSNGGSGTPPLSSSRSIKHHHDGDSLDEDEEGDCYSYSSVSEDDDPLNDSSEATPAGFTSLSLELSQSTAKINNSAVEMGIMTEDVVIVNDRGHYEQQLERLGQLEAWYQTRSTGWTAHTLSGLDLAPLVSCESTTQTNRVDSVDAALQTFLPGSVHQDSQCDLLLPRDEAADALAIAAATATAVTAATKEADLKSAVTMAAAVEAATIKAKEEAAVAMAAAVEAATIKANEEAAAAMAAAVESASIKANEEAVAAMESATERAALELSSAVESATIKAKEEAEAAMAAAVEAATIKANEEAAIALTEAVESATIKANEEAAAAMTAAVESATIKANEEAAIALTAAVESATMKAKEEAALERAAAVAKATMEADTKSAAAIAAATVAARKEAIAETEARTTTEALANTEKAVTEVEASTAAAMSIALAEATAKANEAAANAAKEAEIKAAKALSDAVEAATKQANEAAARSAKEAGAKSAAELAAAVEAANEAAARSAKEAEAKSAAELAVAVEAANEAAARSAKEAEAKSAAELTAAVEAANETAARSAKEAEAKSAAELAAAVKAATEQANEAAARLAKDTEAKSAEELAAAVEAANEAAARSTKEAEAKSLAAMSAAVAAAVLKAKEEALLERSSIPTADQGTQCSCEGVDMAAQVDFILTTDIGVQHEYESVDTAVQCEYTSVDQQTQYYMSPAIDSNSQDKPAIIYMDVSTQYKELEATSTPAPSTVDTGTDPIVSSSGEHSGITILANTPKHSRSQQNRDIDQAAAPSRNIASTATMDSNNDWLGSLNDDAPISLDRSAKLTTPSDDIYTNETDHKLYSQQEVDAKVEKAVEETLAKNIEQQAIHDDAIVPARPTQRPPSSLLDKATRTSSSIVNTTAANDYFDDAGTSSGLNRQLSLSSSYLTNENAAPSRPSNALQYGVSSSGAEIAPPSITSSIHDEHSIMVRPLPNTPDPTISSITQTMIGEWLIKYTRKPMGGQGFSERRHERYFWIHPYTRTLYWCTRAPGAEGGELKAKSAFVENVTVGKADEDSLDGNGIPCLLVQTSTRQIKIRAPTKERHDLWLESLMYLLTRPSQTSALEHTPSLLPQRSVSASVLRKPSIQRINDIFHRTASTSPYTQDLHHHHQHDEDDDDDALENVRLCCDGKHDVGRLEKNHMHRPAYHQRKQHHSSSLDHSHHA